MLNEIRLNVGTEHRTKKPPEITPHRYSSLIFRIKHVFRGEIQEKQPLCGSRLKSISEASCSSGVLCFSISNCSVLQRLNFNKIAWIGGKLKRNHVRTDLHRKKEENIKLTFCSTKAGVLNERRLWCGNNLFLHKWCEHHVPSPQTGLCDNNTS